MLKFDTSFVINKKQTENILKKYSKTVVDICKKVDDEIAPGSEMTGWMHPEMFFRTKEILALLNKVKQWHNLKLKNVVVIGIGGSYIGIKAAIDMIRGGDTKVNLVYISNINSNYIVPILNQLRNQKFGIVVISQSGTTLESAIAFKLFRDLLENNVGIKNGKKYIVAITDAEKGTLHNFAKAKGYMMLSIPNNIGGRFSTLTSVGLFPMALAGADINKILRGAKQALADLETTSLKNNSAYLYACYRHYFHVIKKLQVENFIVYDPWLTTIGLQWQQLFGESEGKSHKGLYPTFSTFTTDLHSLGQYLQQGSRNFFETTLIVETPKNDLKLKINNDDDGLKYLNNKTLDSLTKTAFEGTINAHTKDGGANNLVISISKADEFNYGYLFIWLAKAAMMSAYLLKQNPFDQPGVEAYKKRMFNLLGRK